MWNAPRAELSFNLKGLSAAGFILPREGGPTTNRILWLLAVQIPYILIHILAVLDFFVQPFQLRKLLVTLFLTNNGFQTVVRPLHVFIYRQRIRDFLQTINRLPDSQSEQFNSAERKMREHSKRRIYRFNFILYTYNMSAYAVIIVLALIRYVKIAYCDDKRHLDLEFCEHLSTPLYIYDFWWFLDPMALPTFYYLYAFNIAMIGVYYSIFCASDSFNCSVFVALAERCKFLANIAPKALLPDKSGQIPPFFTAWIKYHQQYQDLVLSGNKIFGPVVFITHVFAALNAMVYTFLVINDSEDMIRSLSLANLFGLAIQFYMYAYAGQQVINKSEELSRATLTAGQVALGAYSDGPAKSALCVVMARCCGSKSDEISGLGYFNISMRFYARIMSVSATYILFTQQLNSK